MKLRYYYNLVKGRTGAINPAKINWKNIKSVIQAWIRGLKKNPSHIQEQIIWRRLQVKEKSPTCWIAGQCVFCGCEILGKTKADPGCEEEPRCYPEMMTKEQWSTFKKDTHLRLFN